MSTEDPTNMEGERITRDEQHSIAAVPQTPLDEVLHRMNSLGRFRAAVLASTEGLPIATACSHGDPDVTAAMVALLRTVSKEAREQLGMGELDEVTIQVRDRTRLVCRCFAADGEELILAVIVEPDGYYRSATAWAMREIDATWNPQRKRRRY